MPPSDGDAGPQPRPARSTPPSEYLMALEPPDPISPVVPSQPTGVHDAAESAATPPAREWAQEPEPEPAAPAAPPAGRPGRGRAVLALVSTVAALALLAAAGFGYLWWDADRELTETREQHTAEVAALTAQNREHEQRIDELSADLRAATADLARLEQELTTAREQADAAAALRDEAGPVRLCLDGQADALASAADGDLLAVQTMAQEVAGICDDAADLLAE